MKYIAFSLCGKTISWAVFEEDSYELLEFGELIAPSVNTKISIRLKTLENIILEQERKYGAIENVAISLPGAVNRFTGLLVQKARWLDQMAANTILQDAFKLKNKKFHFINDASAALIGNKEVGIASKYKNVVYFVCGTGVGASLMINGKLYDGHNNITGEIGQLYSHGTTVESILSLPTILAQTSIVAGEVIDSHEKLYEVAMRNEAIEEFLREWYKTFIETLKNIILFYDPELILIQSEIYELAYFENKDIKKDLRDKVGETIAENINISRIIVGDESRKFSLIGAVASMKEVNDKK